MLISFLRLAIAVAICVGLPCPSTAGQLGGMSGVPPVASAETKELYPAHTPYTSTIFGTAGSVVEESANPTPGTSSNSTAIPTSLPGPVVPRTGQNTTVPEPGSILLLFVGISAFIVVTLVARNRFTKTSS